MRRMTARAVLEHFRVCKHDGLGLFVRLKILQRDPCGFEGVKKAFCHGVSPTVTLTAPPGLHPVPGQELPSALGPIRAATVRMQDQSRRRLTLADGQCQGLGDQLGPPMMGQRPPTAREHSARPTARDHQPSPVGKVGLSPT
ncbi:MAG TPA: hypothetical protein VLQ80_33175 [Candidatus Saccharimonadia bacterium]|nr:hypothetical protein [Candidatus Saccharimonadia bacterium]